MRQEKEQTPKKTWGGARANAGRSKTGIGESKPVRVPVAVLREVRAYVDAVRDELKRRVCWDDIIAWGPPETPAPLTLFACPAAAGFPSPADDHVEKRVDLNDLLIKRSESTYLVRVSGWSMREIGISVGDYLIVDRSVRPANGRVVVAQIAGDGLVVKRLKIEADGRAFLLSENPEFAPIPVDPEEGVLIWGVCTGRAGAL